MEQIEDEENMKAVIKATAHDFAKAMTSIPTRSRENTGLNDKALFVSHLSGLLAAVQGYVEGATCKYVFDLSGTFPPTKLEIEASLEAVHADIIRSFTEVKERGLDSELYAQLVKMHEERETVEKTE